MASNPYVEGYDPERPTKHITYLDANNLHGWAMCQPPHASRFRWTRKMPTEKQILSWWPEQKHEFILEVDLEYSPELHRAHNAYPPAPEKSRGLRAEMSPHRQKLLAGQPEDRTRQGEVRLALPQPPVMHEAGYEAKEGAPRAYLQAESVDEAIHRA